MVAADFVGWQNTGTVSAVDAGLFNMLQYATDHHPLAIGDGVYIHLIGIF